MSSTPKKHNMVLVLGAPHHAYRQLEIGGKDVVDVWGATGRGIRL